MRFNLAHSADAALIAIAAIAKSASTLSAFATIWESLKLAERFLRL